MIHLPHMVSAGHKVGSDPETDSEISDCYGYGDDKGIITGYILTAGFCIFISVL